MRRVRVSTTVDGHLLALARQSYQSSPDSVLIELALTALLRQSRAAEVDASYVAYDEHPIDEADEWGDLASFREAAGAVRGLAGEVVLEPGEDPVPRPSAVNLDSVESVSLGALVERLGRVADRRMVEICGALDVAVAYQGQ